MIAAALVAWLAPTSGSQAASIPRADLDRVVVVELSPGDPVLEGIGPVRRIEHRTDFEGRLHAWATASADLVLRIESESAERRVEDDDSGGRTTPYLRVRVHPGSRLSIAVAAKSLDAPVEARVHLIAAPEDEGTAAACEALGVELAGLRTAAEGRRAEARAGMKALLPRVLALEGAERDMRVEAILGDLGKEAVAQDEIETALAARQALVELRERLLPPSHPALFAARTSYARSLQDAGRHQEALGLQEAILAGIDGDPRVRADDLAVARLNHAVTLLDLERFAEARGLLEHALRECEGSDEVHEDTTLGLRENLAIARARSGDLAGARASFEEVLAARLRTEPPEDDRDVANARINLASALLQLGDASGARSLLETVLARHERVLPEDHPDVLLVRQNLASVLRATGDYHAARAILEDLCARYERASVPGNPRLQAARISLANVLSSEGDKDGARELYERFLDETRTTLPEDHPYRLTARTNLATVLDDLGELAGARAQFEQVLAVREARLPPRHPDLLLGRLNLSAVLREQGDLEGALALQREVERSLADALPAHHPRLLRARSMLASTLALLGRGEEVRAMLPDLAQARVEVMLSSAALGPREAREGLRLQRQAIAALHFAAAACGAGPAAERDELELVETLRAASFDACRARSELDREPELAESRERVRDLEKRWNALALQAPGDEGEPGSELLQVALERDRVERDLCRRLAERGRAVQAVTVASVAEALPQGGAAAGFFLMPIFALDPERGMQHAGDRMLAKVVRSDGTLASLDLGPRDDLAALLEGWRSALGAPAGGRGEPVERPSAGAEADALGRALRERLLDPVLAAAGAGTSILVVCPDDLVHLVPLDALPLDEGCAGDRVRIVIRTSLGAVARASAATGAPSLLALGAVDYDTGGDAGPIAAAARSAPVEGLERSGSSARLAALPETKAEVESVAASFRGAFDVEPVVLEGDRASKHALLESVRRARFLHLATHGWFAGEDLRSAGDEPGSDRAQRMTLDERITGFEPMTLCGLALAGFNAGRDALGRVPGILTAEELATLDLSGCELAVLSACETNVGVRRAGQGIQSLQAALHAAGARTAITSLWKVDDAATRRLFELFYAKLWKEELGKADALWQAKMALRAEGHPVRDWAAWVLSGDPE